MIANYGTMRHALRGLAGDQCSRVERRYTKERRSQLGLRQWRHPEVWAPRLRLTFLVPLLY